MSRSLAHIEEVAWVKPIPAADSIELIGILGWQCISKIGECPKGSKVVYIEIDSLVPKEDERFAFLESKKYKIRSMKLGKKLGSPISQGLAMPLSLFPELGDPEIGTDVTEQLKITYYSPDDRKRKSKNISPDMKYKRMMKKHPKIAKLKISRWLMKREWGKKLLFFFLGNVKDTEIRFPTHFDFINKTDEPRCENLPQSFLFNKEPLIQTLKIDGTSSTYILERKPFNRTEYYVCSRNIRQMDENQKTYHDNNVYWDMEFKYHIRDFLSDMLKKHPNWSYVCLQGETAGEGIQGNPHNLQGVQFFGFNFIDSETGRWGSLEAAALCKSYGIPFVPIISESYVLPDTMEELKAQADGKINKILKGASGLREGFVYRSKDGKRSFKNVSNKYIMKHH